MTRRILVPIAALAVFVGAVAITVHLTAFPVAKNAHSKFMGDFKAFYCAGRVRLEGQNPYDAAPIAACEQAPAPAPLFVIARGEVLPAPLPGYLVAAFVPFGALPFAFAVALWLVLLFAAFAGAVALLRRLQVGDPWTLLVAFSIALMGLCVPVGELPPIALFGIALAAFGAMRDRPGLLGCGVAIAMCEPQIGIAVAIACAALSRRFAIAAGVALGGLALLSFATLGIGGNVAYVRDVLPAHVLSELPSVLQYGLSWVLYGLGVPSGPAVTLGRLQWIVMLAVALFVARSPFGRRNPAFAVLAAPAIVVVGGPFLHLDHIALALPAALWLCARRERARAWNLAAAICLALPLLFIFALTTLLAWIPIVAAWLGMAYTRRGIVALRAAAAALVVMVAIALATLKTGLGSETLPQLQGLSASLAQTPWSAYVRSHLVYTAWTIWLVKAPTWFGVLATAAALLGAAVATPVDDADGADVAPGERGRKIPTR